jgi:class 3 adenylate cyclase
LLFLAGSNSRLVTSETVGASQRRELAAIMFSDVVGYTAIMGRDERKGVKAIADHRERVRALLPRFNGRLVGEIGDGALSSFHSVIDAVACARELQSNLEEDLNCACGSESMSAMCCSPTTQSWVMAST